MAIERELLGLFLLCLGWDDFIFLPKSINSISIYKYEQKRYSVS